MAMRAVVAMMLLVVITDPSTAVADPPSRNAARLGDLRRVFDAELRSADGTTRGIARFDVSPRGTASLQLATSMFDYATLELRRRRGRRLAFAGTCISGGDVIAEGRARLFVRPTRAGVRRMTGMLRCDDRSIRVELSAPIAGPPPVSSGGYVLRLDDCLGPSSSLTFTLVVDDRGVGRLRDGTEHDQHGALLATFDEADVLVAPSRIMLLWAPRRAVSDPPSDRLEVLGLYGTLSSEGDVARTDRRFYVGLPPVVPREGAWRVASSPVR